MLVLSHDDVLAALPPDECATVMAEVLAAQARGETYMPLRSLMNPPDAPGILGLMPAWRGDRSEGPSVFSLKAICVIPTNPARGLDAHQGIVTLFAGDTGIPFAILDASAITAVRTAAVSAVATDLLAREDARVLAVLGGGVQARSHLNALLRVREFEEVRVYAPTHDHARAVIDSIERTRSGGTLVADAAQTARHAVTGADVIVTATNSSTPVLELEWLAAGTHINAVGASTPATRELTPAIVAACAVFADSRESIRNEAGDYLEAVRLGLIGEDHVRAELGEVLAGQAPGRGNDRELTLFRSLGLAVEDLAAAQHAVRTAARLGLGTEVHL
jgi:ornithine cyclodeaminase/alanine dehydrogenase-like protein (mu-crystallin family)